MFGILNIMRSIVAIVVVAIGAAVLGATLGWDRAEAWAIRPLSYPLGYTLYVTSPLGPALLIVGLMMLFQIRKLSHPACIALSAGLGMTTLTVYMHITKDWQSFGKGIMIGVGAAGIAYGVVAFLLPKAGKDAEGV